MKVSVLLPLGAAFVLGSVPVTYAANLFFIGPLGPGPYRPLMPGPGPTTYQAPPRLQCCPYDRVALSPGEPDEDGRIRPTVQVERGVDGKLLPTYHPR